LPSIRAIYSVSLFRSALFSRRATFFSFQSCLRLSTLSLLSISRIRFSIAKNIRSPFVSAPALRLTEEIHMATAAPPLICPQGHGPGDPGTRFCTWCGAGLVAPLAPGEPASANGQSLSSQSAQSLFSAQPLSAPQPLPSEVWQPVLTATPPQISATPAAVHAPPAISTPLATPPAPSFTSATPSAINLPSVTARATVPSSSSTPAPSTSKTACSLCDGEGARLGSDEVICTQCGWLRPLFPGYQLDRSVFLWAQDGQAMMKLQKIYLQRHPPRPAAAA
jgi:hypothetical protein